MAPVSLDPFFLSREESLIFKKAILKVFALGLENFNSFLKLLRNINQWSIH